MWKTASASPPSGGRPRLVADHTHKGGDLFLFTHLLVDVSVLFIYYGQERDLINKNGHLY